MTLGLKRKRAPHESEITKFCLFSRMFGNLPLPDFLEYLGWNVVYGRENCARIGPHISVTDDNNDNGQVCFNRILFTATFLIRDFRCQLFYFGDDDDDYYDYDYWSPK